MSADKRTAVPTGTTDLDDGLRVDCYVRPTVSVAADGAVDRVAERLERLRDDGTVDEYRIVRWPPGGYAGDGESTRSEIVAEFERWAEQRDCSLEPAFRRRELPSSPLSPGADPREEVRVPIVTLALYGGDDGGESDEAATVRGVVPHTDQTTEADRTYTVNEWLSAAEHTGIAVDEPIDETGQSGQATLLEGRQ